MNGFRTWYSRPSPWTRRLSLLGLVGLLLVSALTLIPSPYYVTAPGAAIDTSRLVSVKDGQAHTNRLLMLVVATQPANLFWYLYAKLDSRAVLETRTEFLGNIPDYDKYLELTRQMMADSQRTAKAIALQQAGYGRGVQLVGVKVTDLMTGSPAKGYLQPNDVIVAAGGKPVSSIADLTEVLQGTKPGAQVEIRLRRGDQELTITVPTGEHIERKGTAGLLVFIKQEMTFDDTAVPVQIKPGLITGPSAGLMFTLQIIDQLTPGGLAPDMRIAGTGTIELDGRVGPIGGMRQKVFTAEAAGAQVLFVPRGNAVEAQKAATRIEVVVIDHVSDALNWLKQHRQKAGHSSPAFWS